MGYVKISDPNIIDLNAIHNIINVVNQHSDTLNTLTNNFGASNNSSLNFNANSLENLFDSGTQMIIYGRTMFDSSLTSSTSTSPAGKIYHKNVTFADSNNGIPAFNVGAPIIFLTIHTANSSTIAYDYADARANVYSPTASSFNIRLFLQESITSGKPIFVNWIAIGPKNK